MININPKSKYQYTNKKGEIFVTHDEFKGYVFGNNKTILSTKQTKLRKLKPRKRGKYWAVSLNKVNWYCHQVIYYVFKGKKGNRMNPITFKNTDTSDYSLKNLKQMTISEQRKQTHQRMKKAS